MLKDKFEVHLCCKSRLPESGQSSVSANLFAVMVTIAAWGAARFRLPAWLRAIVFLITGLLAIAFLFFGSLSYYWAVNQNPGTESLVWPLCGVLILLAQASHKLFGPHDESD